MSLNKKASQLSLSFENPRKAMIILWQAVARKSNNYNISGQYNIRVLKNPVRRDYSSDANLKAFYGKFEAIAITAVALDSFTEI